MKVDVVIENPPYHRHIGGGLGNQGSKSLFEKFVQFGLENGRIVCMITPSKWIGAESGSLAVMRRELLRGEHLRKMVDYFNSFRVFKGVMIAGGVSYWVWDKEYKGKLEFTSISKDVDTSIREIGDNGEFLRYSVGDLVLGKIQRAGCRKFMDCVVQRNAWGLPSNFNWGNVVRLKDTDIKVITPSGEVYVDVKDIPSRWVDTWKIKFTSVVNGSTYLKDEPKKVLTSLGILEPGEICNSSYISIPGIKDEDSANNLLSYLKTKIIRFMILQTLTGIHLGAEKFRYVPLVRLDIEWTDSKLCEVFGISDKEFAFMDKMIMTL